MQQAHPQSAFQGSQAQGSGSLQFRRPGGEPPQGTRAPVGRPKKRERNEAVCDPVKQQRIDKSGNCADERVGSLKPEAPSLVGKDGGLCSVASVDRLVRVMTYEWNDSMQRPVDLIVSRTMLAKVVAATVELDCLYRFLKLGGLSILDRWLQDVYVGRPPAEKESSADGDRAIDDLLLALLGALERLPVDLVALKTCSIGKSVNHLCSHRHPDIQRRARKLVDTWKRRVDSETKGPGEARLSMEHSVYPQQKDAGASASITHQISRSEHPAPIENSGVGRGKYASVASLCSSPESQSRASSITLPIACSIDTSSKSVITPLKPSNEGLKSALESAPQPGHIHPQSSEDGRAASSACIPGPCNNQMRVARNNGVSRQRKTTNLSISNTSSVATALSGSVFASKDYAEQGMTIDRSAHGASLSSAAEVCNLPCCSFFQKSSDNAVVYDHPSRSTLNSASSCVADCKERAFRPIKYNQQPRCPEPVKTGIQLLASIAASESSMIDVKSPDSPSVKSASQRATPLPTEGKNPAQGTAKIYNNQPSKAGGSAQEREHYDRNSSTVSSPSETSTHIDTHMCENKRAMTVYENFPSPADTTSETSIPVPHAGKDTVRNQSVSTSNSRKEHENAQSLSGKSKRPCLQSMVVGEAVGESSIVDTVDCKIRAYVMPGTVFDNSNAKKVSTDMPPLRCSKDDSLETCRQGGLEDEQVGVTCKPRRASLDRNSSPCGDAVAAGESTEAFALASFKQNSTRSSCPPSVPPIGDLKNSPLGTHACNADANVTTPEHKQRTRLEEVAASAVREETRRPVFDLNEMLSSGDEGPVHAAGPISNAWRPIQGFSLPASDSMPALLTVPMTPIAVAAAKGSFTLPTISCCQLPTGEPGWKGSAATSAFRPTQPRRSLEKSTLKMPEQNTHVKAVLDFDLNIAADSSAFVNEKVGNAGMGIKSRSVSVKMASKQFAGEALASSVTPRKASEPARAAWDLNQVDEGATESVTKLDLDLNNGPILQDNDDVVLAAKHIRIKDPLPSSNTVASNRLPVHSLSPVTPILMPAYAMPNTEITYPAGGAMPWINGGPHDGLLQYNIFMQNPSAFASSGMACPPLSSMAAGPFQAIPFGFSSASMQGFPAACGEKLGALQAAAAVRPLGSTEPLMASQSRPPYIMGVLGDVVNQPGGMGGFWNRPNLDLNAGPEATDLSNAKDDRRHMFVMNEQMRARPQVVDMAAALQQREQEGCIGMPGSMHTVPLKQSAWR